MVAVLPAPRVRSRVRYATRVGSRGTVFHDGAEYPITGAEYAALAMPGAGAPLVATGLSAKEWRAAWESARAVAVGSHRFDTPTGKLDVGDVYLEPETGNLLADLGGVACVYVPGEFTIERGAVSVLYTKGDALVIDDEIVPLLRGGAVAFDASASASVGVFGSSLTYSHTCTGADRALGVGTSSTIGAVDPTSVTYAAVAMTKQRSDHLTTDGDSCTLWSLLAPASGANNVVITYSGSGDIHGGSCSATGVGSITGATGAHGTSTTPSVVVTSATGDLVFAHVTAFGSRTTTIGAGETELYDFVGATSTLDSHGFREAGAASVTIGPTLSGSNEWGISAFNFKAPVSPIYEQSDYLFTYGTGGGPPSWVAGALPAILSATGTADNVAGTTVAAAYPAVVAAGDLLIFVVGKDDDATGITDTTGGLTAIGAAGNGGSGTDGVCLGIWYKIAVGNEDGTTHTFTGDSEEFQVFCLRLLAGSFDPLNPIDSVSTLGGATSGTVATTPAFNAVKAGGLVVAVGAVDVDPMDATFSPAGWTDVADNAAGQITAFVATRDAATTLAEAIGATSFGINPDDAWAARAFVINAPEVAAGRIAYDAKNTPVTLPVDSAFGAQIRVENSGGAGDDDFRWQYRLNGGTWTDITSSSSVVRAAATADFANGDDVPEFIRGTGTYITNNNAALDTTGALTLAAVMGVTSAFETHLNFTIQSGDVVNGDDIELRLVSATSTVLDTYSQTPTIEVNEVTVSIVPIIQAHNRRRLL